MQGFVSVHVRVGLKLALCSVVPWSLEGHAVSPLPCETGHACSLIYFFILSVIAGITNVFFCLRLAECHSFVPLPQPNNKHSASQPYSTSLPYYFTRCLSFTWPFQKAMHSQLPSEMRSNTYRALVTTLFITINVSSSLHPSLTFITLLEMSNVFATVITPWWPWGSEKCLIQ